MFEPIRATFFPYELAPGIRAIPVTDAAAFWAQAVPLLEAIFPPFSQLGAYTLPAEREPRLNALGQAFAQSHHERFLFQTTTGEAIGFSYGDLRDRETFFMTSSGVLPAYQRQGLYSRFLRRFLSYLHLVGYERVVSNHQPNNRAVIIAKLKAGFNVTAVNLDERWGAQVELTYLFAEDRRRGFARAFSLDERPAGRSH